MLQPKLHAKLMGCSKNPCQAKLLCQLMVAERLPA